MNACKCLYSICFHVTLHMRVQRLRVQNLIFRVSLVSPLQAEHGSAVALCERRAPISLELITVALIERNLGYRLFWAKTSSILQ